MVVNHGFGVPDSQSNVSNRTAKFHRNCKGNLRTWTVVPSLVFTKGTGCVLACFMLRAGEHSRCAYHHPKFISPNRVCQELLGITTENSRVDLFVTAHCDSLITQSDILRLSSSLKGKSGTLSCSQSSGKWCAALNVSALDSQGGIQVPGLPLAPGRNTVLRRLVPREAFTRVRVMKLQI